MSKRFRFWSRCVLVATMTVLVTFNPAWAGRGLRGWLNKRAAASCECEVACCEPAPVCSPAPTDCCEAASATPICCDPASTVSSDQIHIAPFDSTILSEPSANTSSPTTILPSVLAPELSPSDAKPVQPEVKKLETTQPDKKEAPKAETTPPSVDDVFGNSAPKTDVAPAETPKDSALEVPAKPTTPPSEDPFGAPSTPAEPAPTTTPSEDPFGAPSTPAEPAPSAPADDLFGAPSTPAEPAPTAPADDLFGAPSTPAEPAPSTPADDLFGAPSTPVEPAPTAPADDLFGTPSTPAPTTPADDLFGTPSAPAEKAADDLFGNPASIEVPKTEKSDDPFSDIFSENKMRVWQDNTGNFKVEAQLVEIHSDSIRLRKSNGNYSRVPLRRLSPADLKLVEKIASRLPAGDVKMVSINNAAK